ncbi:MAG: sigma-70 family RNA polymerase sigma factor [Bacteroidales bacterium]|nr:sigma-70 family RNA polymerase sigma factor [Bacteroidales bacterium]
MEIISHLSPKAQRDYQLIQLALTIGDQKAFAELLNYYRDPIYFMLLRKTNNPLDAEDLTIEAFGKAFKNLHQYTTQYAFSTWLFSIASNNCIDFLRRKKRNSFQNDDLKDNDYDMIRTKNIPSKLPDPEEKIIIKQKIKMMREIVEKLKPHYRTLIELRYFQEMSYDEISKELDIPLGTVKAQLFRAREFLYNIMKNIKEKI